MSVIKMYGVQGDRLLVFLLMYTSDFEIYSVIMYNLIASVVLLFIERNV